MKSTKIMLLSFIIGSVGCSTSPLIPALTSTNPASEKSAEGNVDVPSIEPTKLSEGKVNSDDSKRKPHDMSKMKGMGSMNVKARDK